jgi:uncharacterized delta-60 repeat protein
MKKIYQIKQICRFAKRAVLLMFLLAVFPILVEGQNDGAIDSAFGINGYANSGQAVSLSQFGSILVQPDSNIVCIQRTGTSSVYDIALVRYLPDGSLDNSFGSGGVALTVTSINETPICAALQSDGKILVGSTSTNGGASFGTVSRYKTNGLPDSSFALNGIYKSQFPLANSDGIASIALLPGGEIIVSGNTYANTLHNSSIIKLLPNGILDSTFGINGRIKGNKMYVFSSVIQSDGKIVLGGRTSLRMAITRYKSTGVVDSTFGINGLIETKRDTTFMSWAENLFVLPNGSIIGAGALKTSNGLLIKFMAMEVGSNGAINTSYGVNGAAVDSLPGAYIITPAAAAMQADHKLIIAGQIALDDSTGYRFGMVRFNTNGTVDGTFGHNGIVVDSLTLRANCNAIAIQHDNKILLGGTRSFGSGPYTIAAARFRVGTIISGAEEVKLKEQKFAVYPNPSNGKITVVAKGKLEIYNLMGEKIYEQTLNENSTILNVNTVRGIYFVRVSDGEKLFTEKLVIQ